MRTRFSRTRVCTTAAAVFVALLTCATESWALTGRPQPSALTTNLLQIAGSEGLTRVDNIVPAGDGVFWVFLHDNEATVRSGRVARGDNRISVHRVDASGRQMSPAFELTESPGLEDASQVRVLGALPSGALVVSCLLGDHDPVRYRLARIGRTGVEAVFGELLYQDVSRRCVVDPLGSIRVFFSSPEPNLVTMLLDGESEDFHVLERTCRVPEETPQYLAWSGRTALASSGPGQMLVAVERSTGDSLLSVYRLTLGALELLDSVQLNVGSDAYRKIVTPSLLTGLRWVPESDGFWLLVSPKASGSSQQHDSSPATAAFHLNASLVLDTLGVGERVEVLELADAPRSGVLEVLPATSHRRVEVTPSGWDYLRTLDLTLLQFGSDGRIYASHVKDSLAVSVPQQPPAERRGQ